MTELVLKVNGRNYHGWQEINLGFSLESIANTFELTLTDKWAGNNARWPIHIGDACEVWLDDVKVITGYVDDVFPEYDAENHSITVAGRSKAGDLVDCTHKGKQWKQPQTIKQLADELCKPFGIKVIIAEGVDIGKPFKTIEIEPGESHFEFLEQAARIRALRLVSNVDGDIVITRASKDRTATPLILGENILSASGEFSLRDRFSDYTVTGSKDGDDSGFGASAALIQGKYQDAQLTRLKRYRPTTILADGSVTIDDCQIRANWEGNTRFGRSRGVVYTVTGWMNNEGAWQPNVVVPVKDDYTETNGDLLIVAAQLIMDDKGMRSELQVMAPEAFELIPLPEPESDSGGL